VNLEQAKVEAMRGASAPVQSGLKFEHLGNYGGLKVEAPRWVEASKQSPVYVYRDTLGGYLVMPEYIRAANRTLHGIALPDGRYVEAEGHPVPDTGGLAAEKTLLDEVAMMLMTEYMGDGTHQFIEEAACTAYKAAAIFIAAKRDYERGQPGLAQQDQQPPPCLDEHGHQEIPT